VASSPSSGATGAVRGTRRGAAGESVTGAGSGPAVDAVAEHPARVLGLSAAGQVIAGAFHQLGRARSRRFPPGPAALGPGAERADDDGGGVR
jgi:hypothetical protein